MRVNIIFCAKNRDTMNSTSSKKKQSFNTPIVNKISRPLPYSCANSQRSPIIKDDRFKFDQYDKAFMMRRTSRYCYYQTVIVDFEPKAKQKQNQKVLQNVDLKNQDARNQLWHPVYNKDRRYYTPAFVLGQDLRDYAQYPRYDYEKFNEKLIEAKKRTDKEGKNKSKIFCPKPSSTKCQICRCQYQDYLQHIKQENHIKLFKESRGWDFINQFIQNFHKNRQQVSDDNNREQPQPKRSKIHTRHRIEQQKKSLSEQKRQKQTFKTKLITKKLPAKLFGQKGKISGISSTHITVSKDISGI